MSAAAVSTATRPTHSVTGESLLRITARISLATFTTALVTAHWLNPELEITTHMVSEYAVAPHGQVMVVGFAAWTLSLACTALLAPRASGPGGRRLSFALGAATVGLLLVTSFPTDTVAGALPPGHRQTLGGQLHDAGAALALLGLISSLPAGMHAVQSDPRRSRIAWAAVAIVGLLVLALLAQGPAVAGLRQRVLVLAAVIWEAALIRPQRIT